MTTSGSSDFNRTRNQIIHRAGRLVGAVRAGSTMKDKDVSDFSEALNAMVKRWSATPGMHVWTITDATLFPQVDQVKYALGTGSTDHATETYYATEISSGGEASGQTILSVESTTNINVSDYIGIVVDDGTIHWSTVASKTASTVTIATAIDDAAAAGNAVFTYMTKIVRPLKITDARLYTVSDARETPIDMIARRDYRELPNKTQSGAINQAFYDPQLTLGYIHLWNPPSAVTDLVKFTWHRPIQDFDAAGDNPDLPAEWIDAMVYNLALQMAPEYETPRDKINGPFGIGAMAVKYLDDVAGFDREAESVFFQPDME